MNFIEGKSHCHCHCHILGKIPASKMRAVNQNFEIENSNDTAPNPDCFFTLFVGTGVKKKTQEF